MAVAPHYPTEPEAAAAFDAAVASCGLFNSYPEVVGTLTQPRPGQIDKGVRIDRLLVPTDKLLALGWRHGIIGVEIKRSDAHLGRAIAQAMDYTRAVWTLPGSNFAVVASWVFVYPFDKQHGDLASLMAQGRVGTASSNDWAVLRLNSGEANVLHVSHTGEVRIGGAAAGRKVGSR